MKTVIERIEAGKVLPQTELNRLGIQPGSFVRVEVETLDEPQVDFEALDDDSLTAIVDEEIEAYRAERKRSIS